jgi:hypothetical protein
MLGLRHHEFWNSHFFHLPIYLYWIFLSIRARSPLFFSAANPGIENGGMIGESKHKILEKINPIYLPKAILIEPACKLEEVTCEMAIHGIKYPFVSKPDIGQGGWLIELIENEAELSQLLKKIKMPFIIQEFINEPVEVGVLYYRLPTETKGVISSFCTKELLSVMGDGIHNVEELLMANERAGAQLKRLKRKGKVDLKRIPAQGEKVSVSFVGNHSYGTRFIDQSHLVDKILLNTFDELCSKIEGFYFGRFDIRCKSIDALKAGDFKILELNGVGSEPLHIFDPRTTLRQAYRDALKHWDIIYKISQQNRAQRLKLLPLREAFSTYRNLVRIQRLHQTSFTIGN